MEYYFLIRLAHGIPAVLLLVGIFVHILVLVKAKRKADENLLKHKIIRTARVSLPAFMLLTLTLPITGWWLTHLAQWPLDLKWIFIPILLLPLVFILAVLVGGQLLSWSRQASVLAAVRQPRLSLLFAVLLLLVLVIISAVMGAKPL